MRYAQVLSGRVFVGRGEECSCEAALQCVEGSIMNSIAPLVLTGT